MALVSDLLAAIPTYTGFSAGTFFTLVAVAFAFYYVVSGWFASPPPAPKYVPPPPPAQLGDVTEEELRDYDGNTEGKPLLMAIKGKIYDVTMSRGFYGPGGPYALFAGKDASRALAKMSFEEEDLNGNLEGLNSYELDVLSDWEYKFESKYVKVGQIVKKDSSVDTNDVPKNPEVSTE